MSKWPRYHYIKIVIMLEYKITNWHLQGPLSLGLLKCIKGFCRYIQRYRTGLGIFPSHWSCRSAMFAAFLRPSFLFPCSIFWNSRSPSLANKRNLETKSLRLVMKKNMFKFEWVYYKTYVFSMINILRIPLFV